MTPGRIKLALAALTGILILAGCSSSSKRGGGYYKDDGPGRNIPANIEAIPDAVPRIETHSNAARRPYSIFGKTYRPLTAEQAFRQEGRASWYGRKFHGKKTASGEVYDMYAMTAAHPTLPIPSYARVTRVKTGRSVIVRVNDRGPFHSSRIIDLSYVAAAKLGLIEPGSGHVIVEAITNRDIAQAQKEGRSFAASGPSQVPRQTARNELPAPAGSVRVNEAAANKPAVAGTLVMASENPPAPALASQSTTASDMPDALAVLSRDSTTDVTTPAVAVAAQAEPIALNTVSTTPAHATSIAPRQLDAREQSLSPQTSASAQITQIPGKSGLFLQFGAFSGHENAVALASRLNRQITQIEHRQARVEAADNLYKVQIGPYPTRTEAVNAAVRIQEHTGKNPTIVAIR